MVNNQSWDGYFEIVCRICTSLGHQDFPTKYAYPTKPCLSLFFGRKYVLLFFIGLGSFKPTRDINTLTSKYNVSLAKEKLTYLHQYSYSYYISYFFNFYMVSSCSIWSPILKTVFVFDVWPFLLLSVNFFGFNGNFNGKMTKINKMAKNHFSEVQNGSQGV